MGGSVSKSVIQQAISRLVEGGVSADDAEFWDAFFLAEFHVLSDAISDSLEEIRDVMPLLIKGSLGFLSRFIQDPNPSQLPSVRCALRVIQHALPWIFARDMSAIDEDTGTALVHTVMKFLFCPSLTLSSRLSPREEDNPDEVEEDGRYMIYRPEFLWESGVGVQEGVPSSTSKMIADRVLLLDVLMSILSDTMFLPPSHVSSEFVKPPLSRVALSTSCPHAAELFFSLINVICRFHPGNTLPYTNLISQSSGMSYVRRCVQMLAALLRGRGNVEGNKEVNVYVLLLSKMNIATDLAFIFNGITENLLNLVYASNTYFPNSMERINFDEELLFVVWSLLSENQFFRVHAAGSLDVRRLLVPLLFFLQESMKKWNEFRKVELCAYILLQLSTEREFGVALNSPYREKYPLSLPNFKGNYADLLFLMLFKFMLRGPQWIGSLYDCFLMIMANASGYTKKFCSLTSSRLVALFEGFSRPKYLRLSPKNHRYVFYLLDMFNNMIQYHFEGNIHLVYEILRRRIVFQELAKLPDEVEPSNADEGSSDEATTSEEVVPPKEKEPVADSSVSEQEFVFTPQFEREWKSKLPINTILRMLEVLVPQLTQYIDSRGHVEEAEVLKWLGKITLVGLLPVPHEVFIRPYEASTGTIGWLHSSLWSCLFEKRYADFRWDTTFVRLFGIRYDKEPDASVNKLSPGKDAQHGQDTADQDEEGHDEVEHIEEDDNEVEHIEEDDNEVEHIEEDDNEVEHIEEDDNEVEHIEEDDNEEEQVEEAIEDAPNDVDNKNATDGNSDENNQ